MEIVESVMGDGITLLVKDEFLAPPLNCLRKKRLKRILGFCFGQAN